MSSDSSSPPLHESESAHRKSSFFSKIFVNHTKKTCTIGIIIPIICILVIAASSSLSLSDNSSREFFVLSDIRSKLADARFAARDDYPFLLPGTDNATLQQRELDVEKNLAVLLRAYLDNSTDKLASIDDIEGASNILTKQTIMLHKQTEDVFYTNESYPKFCKRDSARVDCDGNPKPCELPNSYLNHPSLYGLTRPNSNVVCDRRNGTDLSDEDYQAFITDLFGNDTRNSRNYFDLNMTNTGRRAWAIKSTVLIGTPFEGFNSSNDRSSDQSDLFVDWAEPLTEPINDDESLSSSTTDVYVLSSELINSEFSSIIIRDLTLAVIAIILVLLVIWIHTSSLYLTTSAITQVLLAFPFAYFVYYFIFRQLYFSTLQILTIFLILGIGADDVFVFTDAWKQAMVVLPPDTSTIDRMTWTYNRAVRAMTVTSFTTAAAFFVTATSPIMPISTLGVWAGCLVLLQFVLVITVYPCAVIIWDRFWRPRMFVRGFKKIEDPEELEKELATPIWHRILPKSIRPEVKVRGHGEYRAVEWFFRIPWMKMLQMAKFFLVFIAVALAGFSIYRATTLETPLETESFLPNDHPFIVASDTITDAFPSGDIDLQLRVWVTWGIETVSRKGLSRYDVDETGKTVFDTTFDLKPAAVQTRILEACDFFNKEELIFAQDTGIERVNCWIADYQRWRVSQGKGDAFETFATDKALVDELLEFAQFTQPNGVQPYMRYFSDQRIGFTRNLSRVLFTEVGFVGNIEAQAPESQMSPVYDLWQGEMKRFNDGTDIDAGNKAIATAGYTWMWMYTQQTLLRSMLQGLGIMIVVALCTLLVSTQNIIVAILATLCIGGVICMLLAFISVVGWYLGVTESVSVIIGIGYSFDGVAHIATAYVESSQVERFYKVKDALTDLGISVLFGSITTLVAGLALTPATIIFFTKFAALLIATVILSMIWSLVFFPALLLVLGPKGEFGSLAPVFRKLNFFKKSGRDTAKTESKLVEDENEETMMEQGKVNS